jgi:transcriptional regulator with XRE-family HTH domain
VPRARGGCLLECYFASPTMAAQAKASPFHYAASLLPVGLTDQRSAFNTELGARLRAQRLRIQVTIAELADLVGLYRSTLSRMERGLQQIFPGHLVRLCAGLLALVPRAARDVAPGEHWLFREHRTMAAVMADEMGDAEFEQARVDLERRELAAGLCA